MLNNPLFLHYPDGRFAIPLFSFALGGAAFCPLTWGVAAALVVGYAACWGVQTMIDNGSLQAGSSAYTVTTGLVGGLTGSMINMIPNNVWDLGSLSMQIGLTGYGNLIHKDNSNIESEKKTPPLTEPKNLQEQLALEEAKGGAGKEIEELKDKIKDPRYPKEIWEKKQHIHDNSNGTNINIHYWENRLSGQREGFKFKK